MFFLNSKPGWFGQQLNNNIASLQTGNYGTVPWILCVFSENHELYKEVAAKALCEALDKMTFDDLVHVDEQMRQTTSMEWSINWRKFSLENFFTAKMSGNERRAVIIFASFNPNGFIREKAVQMMKDYSSTLPFILLRQNNWVQQVRTTSVDTTNYRLMHLSKGELLAALPFADKLSRAGRLQKPNVEVKRIFTALTAKLNEKDMLAGLQSNNIRMCRICTIALFNAETPRYDLAFVRLQAEPEPFLRTTIFRNLKAIGQNMNAVIERFIKDKYPLNRVLAFHYLCDTENSSTQNIAVELLLDKSADVRKEVRYYLNSRKMEFDYRTYYKSKLTDKVISAIYGLGETGKSEDTADIEAYLHSPLVSVARAAMTAVMRLNPAKYVPEITELLADERASMVKTACNAIIKFGFTDYSRILEILKTSPYENTKKKCFSILLTATKWQRLIYILDVLENGKKEIEENTYDALVRWILSYNRSYMAVTEMQQSIISESLTRLERKIPVQLQKQLRFLLR